MAVIQVILSIIYVLLGIAISIVILMQEGKSNGLGGAIGGMAESYWSKKRPFHGGCIRALYKIRRYCIYDHHTDPEYYFKGSGIIIRTQKHPFMYRIEGCFFK